MKNKMFKQRFLPISIVCVFLGLSNLTFADELPELGSVYNPASQYEIAKKLIDEPSTSAADFETGLKWLRLSAAQQYPEALYMLGFYHEFGVDGVTQNYNKAIELYEQAANKGHVDAQFNLSALFFRDDTPVHDINLAHHWLKQAADHNSPLAQYSLAMFYHDQLEVKKSSPQKIVKWLNKSASNGYKEAQYTLGTYYLRGDFLPLDHTKALYWFEQAAQQGDAPSQYNVALMYELGHGTVANDEKALFWYQKAATQSEAGALFNLGRKYLLGQGVDKHTKKGIELISAAAEAGNPAAQTMLANHFLIGQHTEKDFGKAFQLYLSAAHNDYPEAQYRVSVMFAKGQGVIKDEKKSVHWISKAAKQNHPTAQYGLGAYLFNGVGVEKDVFLAAYWMSRAALQGQKHALKSRDSVIKLLSDSQLDDLNKQINKLGQAQGN